MAARLAHDIAELLARPDVDRSIGPFKLVQPLGRGGFAPVWLANEVYGGVALRTVAIKLFALEESSQGEGSRESRVSSIVAQRERIVDEARALCQVEHPNVVRFYAIATNVAETVMGLVMEHVHGISVDKRLDADKTLSVPETLAIGTAVASALASVHQVGLVHRDVKPANVIESAGVYKLIDFGIAAAETPPAASNGEGHSASIVVDDLLLEVTGVSGTGGTIRSRAGSNTSTASGNFVGGTIGYIDPACVATSAPATPASDLYSLGAMLFECVTGAVPAVAAARAMGTAGLKHEVLDGRASAPHVAELAPAAPPSFARLVDTLLDPDPRKRPRSAEAVAWELERIRRELAGRSRALPPESIGPFRGLARFEEADRDVYFGRAVEIAASLETLRSRGLLALIGPSGSGKSSLARAGVLAALTDGSLGGWPKRWDAVVMVPGADPRDAMAVALAPYVDASAMRDPDTLVAALAERAQVSGRGVAILVDQLEELTTTAEHLSESQEYVARVLARLGATLVPGVRAIVAARRDLLDSLLAIDELGRTLTRGSLLVGPMSDATWSDVLDQALDAYGYRLEDSALRTELLRQLRATEGAMPLVQFALTQLWDRRDTARKIVTRAALEEIGGIAGALEMHAEATLREITHGNADAETTTKLLLLELTTAQGTRATRPQRELEARFANDVMPRALAALESARLVVRESGGVTIAHEALLASWRRLKSWISEAREDRLLAEEIERDASAWAEEGGVERVWRKRRLAAAEDLLRNGAQEISPGARRFIKAGRSLERRGRVSIAIGGAVLVVGAGIGGAYYVASTVAEETKRAVDGEKKQCDQTVHAISDGYIRKNADCEAKADTCEKHYETCKEKLKSHIR